MDHKAAMSCLDVHRVICTDSNVMTRKPKDYQQEELPIHRLLRNLAGFGVFKNECMRVCIYECIIEKFNLLLILPNY